MGLSGTKRHLLQVVGEEEALPAVIWRTADLSGFPMAILFALAC